MKFFVKNKVFSWGGGSKVYDETGKELFKVKGKVFSITRKKKIYSLDKELLYIVKNKVFNWWTHKSFILDSQKQQLAQVQNRGFKRGFDVVGCSDEITIDGFSLLGFNIVKNGQVIGTVTRKITFIADAFEINLNDGEDPAFITALVIAIDNVMDRASRRA